MKKAAFIINPYSAKKNYQPFLDQLQKKIPGALYLVSGSIEETRQFIKEHWEHTDVFVAVGGDGTISTVAQQLIGSDKVLGVFPAGSGNGFSRENRFSDNLDELLQKIEKGAQKAIDTFTVNGQFSINVAGVGFDGHVAEAFEKTSRGLANYIKISLSAFFTFKPMKVEFEGQHQPYSGHYLMVTVANSRQFGNNAFIAPQADLSDGQLEIVLVKKFPFWYALPFAYRMFTKKLRNSKYLQYFSSPEIALFTECAQWHLDGECRSIPGPVTIRILPGSLNVLAG